MSKRPPHATYVEVPTPESSRLQSATTPSRSKHEEQSSTGPSHPPLIRETSQIRAAFNSFTGLGDDESAFEERQKWNQRRLRRISNKYNCKLDELSKELNSGDQRGGSATVAGTPMSVIGTPAVFDPFHSVESGVTPTIRGFFNARSTRGSFAVPQTPLQRSMASAGNVHRFPATPGVAPESSTTFGSFQQEPRMSGRTPKRQDSVPKIFFESFSAFLKTGSVTPQRRRPPPLTSRSSFDIEQINEREFMQEDVLDRLAEENSPSGIVFRMSETQPRTAGEQIALVQLGQRDPSSSGSLDQTGKSSMAASSRFRTTIEGVPTESVITEETSFELDEDERDAPGPSSSSWSSRSGGRRGRRPHRFPVSQPIFDDSSMSATAALEPLIEEKERPSEEDEGKSSRIPHSKSQPASIQRYKTFDEDIRRPSDLMQGSTLLEHSKSLPQGFPGREIPETRAPASAVEAMEAQSAEQDFKTKILRPFKSFKRTLSRKKTSADGGKGVHENPGVPPTPQPTSKHHKVMSSKTVSVNEEMFFDKVPPTPAKPMRISLMPQEVDAYHPDAASPPRTPFVFDVVPDDVPSIDGAPLAAQPFAMSDVAGISRIALGDAHIVRAQRARLGPHPIAPSVGEPDRPTSQTIDSTATRKMLQRQKSIDRSAFLEAHMDRFAMAVQKHNPEQRQHRKKARIRGIGRLGRCIGRNLQKSKVSRLPENLRNRIEEGEDERVFFTYWVTTIQILVCLMSILFYGLGPFGLDRVEKHGEVMDTTLTYRRVSFHEPVHFWMGPNFADLIRLGAKYSPCMRRERNLWKVIEEERQQENKTGCCIYNDNSGCYQTGKNACPRSLATWNRWDQKGGPLVRRTSGPVCGQDPEYCDEPQSHALSEWPDDLTQWPICTKTRSGGFLPRHMTCPVTGRPCCIQVQGLCRITTKEYCTFVRGHYHENATLCSQVDCLSDVCGMLPFFNKDHPNQLYRLFVSLFLHAGIFHCALTVWFQMCLMRDLEMLIGWPRMALLYFSSGIGGNLASAIFVPYNPELGPSGSHFGLLAALLVDLYHHRSIIENSGRGFVYYGLILCFLFLAGALPYVDNWAHIFGFIFGLLVTIITFPYLDFHEQEPSKSETSTTELLTPPYGQRMTPSTPTFAYGGVIVDINGTPESPGTLVDFYKAVKCLLATANRRTIAVFLSSVVLVALFLTLSYVFFANKEVDCPWCSYFNCINVFGWDHFCDNNGQELTKMLPI